MLIGDNEYDLIACVLLRDSRSRAQFTKLERIEARLEFDNNIICIWYLKRIGYLLFATEYSSISNSLCSASGYKDRIDCRPPKPG